MKILSRFTILCFIVIFTSCKNKTQQASLEGTILNLDEKISEVTLLTDFGNKILKIKNGTFKDTLSKETRYAILQIGSHNKMLFLDANTRLRITADANDFNNTIKFKGKGKNENEYLHNREMITVELIEKIDSLNQLPESDFMVYINQINQKISALLTPNLSPKLLETETEQLNIFIQNLEQQFHAINQTQSKLTAGKASPLFLSYENNKGGETSLSDLKGSYVYIDIWATWCPPCRAEIPYLKKLEEHYKHKNIKFVSISIDNPSAKDKWRAMIKDKDMGGIQLFANGDPKGNIVLADAPRPSDDEIRKLLNGVLD